MWGMRETTTYPLDVDELWAISVPEAGRRLAISRAHAYRLVASGDLPSVRLGHRTVVPLGALRSMLAGTDAGDLPPVASDAGGPLDTSGASASGHLVRHPEDSLGGGDEADGGAAC